MKITDPRKESLPVVLRRNLYAITFMAWFFLHRLAGTDFSLRGIWLGYYEMEIDLAAVALLLIHMLLNTRFRWYQLLAVAVGTGILGVSMKITEYSIVFVGWMFIVAAKDQDIDELTRMILWTVVGAMLMTFGLYFIGRIHDVVQEREGGWLRHSFGYGHPNALGLTVMQIAGCWFVLRRKRISRGDLLLGSAAAAFIYLVPNSQTACGATILLVLLGAYCRYGCKLPEGLRKAAPWVLSLGVLGANLLSLGLTFGFPLGGIMHKISGILSTRPGSAYKVFAIFGIPLLGQQLPPMDSEMILNGKTWIMPWIDSGYFSLLLRYGLLSYLVISLLYLMSAHTLRKTNNLILLGLVAILAMYGIMEMALYDLTFNPLAILLCTGLYGTVCETAQTEE